MENWKTGFRVPALPPIAMRPGALLSASELFGRRWDVSCHFPEGRAVSRAGWASTRVCGKLNPSLVQQRHCESCLSWPLLIGDVGPGGDTHFSHFAHGFMGFFPSLFSGPGSSPTLTGIFHPTWHLRWNSEGASAQAQTRGDEVVQLCLSGLLVFTPRLHSRFQCRACRVPVFIHSWAHIIQP